MGMTVYIKTYRGEIVLRGELDLRGVVADARRIGLALLGSVDEYDDTVFNRKQTEVLARELTAFAERGDHARELAEVEQMIQTVQARPHRYLVFNGD